VNYSFKTDDSTRTGIKESSTANHSLD